MTVVVMVAAERTWRQLSAVIVTPAGVAQSVGSVCALDFRKTNVMETRVYVIKVWIHHGVFVN